MFLVFGILLLLATFSAKISSRVGIPGLIIFLSLGMIFGSDGLNLIYFDDPHAAQQAAIVLLIWILFEGGFGTKRELLKVTFAPAFTLATIGVILTAVVIGSLSHWILGINLAQSMLIGAIIGSTDAAAVFAIFKDKSIEPRTAATLEVESASNDPMAIILTTVIIDYIQGNLASPVEFALQLGWQIAAGLLVGYAVGKIAPYVINKAKLGNGGFYYVLALGFSFLSYGLADFIGANGFMAVYITGFYLGNSEYIYKQSIGRFLEGASTFSQVMLFLMLGLLVFPSQAIKLWPQGIAITLILIFLARPLAVFICTAFSKYTLKQKVFMCWGGLKGAVPIVLATYPYGAGLPDGGFYFNIVFFAVLISAVIQGTTMDWAATKLGLLHESKKTSPYAIELISLENPDFEIVEYEVCKDSILAGNTLSNISLPKDSLVSAIVRNSSIIAPRGDTMLLEGDLLFLLVKSEDKRALKQALQC
ncbi:potassium/proton antiporter [Lutispora sp.]|uniref:potassium/proton antiporter n=1 Tax=Lutispora sp. TaxID=2828727 RepID=UPI002B20C5BA|nr:potassium/proton antiporter [Lutispora sp.]MEA4962593.1 potassium/proton antiporter [Lutispora sp.]